jgi:hypothetical protein
MAHILIHFHSPLTTNKIPEDDSDSTSENERNEDSFLNFGIKLRNFEI